MKSIVLFLVLGLVAYGLWEYVESHPASTQVAMRVSARNKDAPSPEPTPTEPPDTAPKAPNLAQIALKTGRVLTNAKLKTVRPSGVLFLCDQGLVEVPLGNLPDEMASYYAPMVVPEMAPAGPTPVPPTPTPAPVARPQKSYVQDAQDRLAYASQRVALKDRIAHDQQIIDQWYKQSSFVKDGYVTESVYNATKADMEAAIAQLSLLESNGPGN